VSGNEFRRHWSAPYYLDARPREVRGGALLDDERLRALNDFTESRRVRL
jgi:hypothetical protein